MTPPPARQRQQYVAGPRARTPHAAMPTAEAFYDRWSWRALALWCVKHPGPDTFVVVYVAAFVASEFGVLASALLSLASLAMWHAWRVWNSILAASPLRWRLPHLAACWVLLIALGSGPLGQRMVGALPALALIAALTYPVRAIWRRVRLHTTHEGTVVAMTTLLAVVVAGISWAAFDGTVPQGQDLRSDGGLAILTPDTDQDVQLHFTPTTETPFGDDLDTHRLQIRIDTDGPWLLVSTGRWHGTWQGALEPATDPITVDQTADGRALNIDGTRYSVRWLSDGPITQYQGTGEQTLDLELDRPFLFDDAGHRTVVYPPAGCLTNLPWAATLQRGAPNDLTIDGWTTPTSCTVVQNGYAGHDDYIESATRAPTLIPNSPTWVFRTTSASQQQLAQLLEEIRPPAEIDAEGRITLPLFVNDDELGPGGARDLAVLTSPAQIWKADSESVTGQIALRQAMAVTGFGAAGALLGSVMLSGVRLRMGLTQWRQQRFTVPGVRARPPRTRRGPDRADTDDSHPPSPTPS